MHPKRSILSPSNAWLTCLLALASIPHYGWSAPDPFAEGVRPTPWQSPADQEKSFRLPPGFEIQLVAAEPNINKPMNLAFDTQGRLWVTTSIEYPYAAPTSRPGRDRLMIFEDFGPDGRARKITQFADGLNIPIGVYPFLSPPSSQPETRNPKLDTWKAIVWSIPTIWLFEDTDGDGKADKREVLYGPFDHTRDTHGNQASFRRGFDGWLYATHGYNNDSHVKGRDGHQVDLNSGNTYRIRLDGSRIEHHTHGQVNPYGLAFDPLGNLFSSDCHSEPVYQLLAGGYYPSFGKPHDGLGFAPNMMEKIRGSTAIDGISIYADDLWPEEYRGNVFFGDVMASRVMRDRTVETGSTLVSKAAPDFVVTTDPWFRPVDTLLGPDGAFYIADFYNRIIGHYEVPLTHPGRDRTSGRIWRVVYRDSNGRPRLRPAALPGDLKGLVKELASPSLPRRMLAMNAIVDRFGKEALKEVEDTAAIPANPEQEALALWILHRLGALPNGTLMEHARLGPPVVRVHAQRIAADLLQRADGLTPVDTFATATGVAMNGLTDKNALVQRCAAEVLGNFNGAYVDRQLLELHKSIPAEDTHLLYVVRKAIRDRLQRDGCFDWVNRQQWTDADINAITDVAIAAKSPAAAVFLLRQLPALAKQPDPTPSVADVLKHAARYAPESELDSLASFARQRIPQAYGLEQYQELERQFALFKSVDEGLQQRGSARPASIRDWGTNLVWTFFHALDGYHSWTTAPYDPSPTAVPWDLEIRTGTDGRKRQLTSSLPHGEGLTGVLRSPDFPLPPKLSFWLCGHDGFPDKPAKDVNLVRLRLHGSGEVLASAPAPRNDTARRITWELPEHTGKRVFIEAVDGDTGNAYAWIAFGGFEPELSQLRPSEFSPRKMRDWLAAATDAAVRLQMNESAPIFARLVSPQRNVGPDASDAESLAGFARAWVALAPDKAVPVLASALTNNYGPVAYRESVADLLATQNAPAAQAAVVAALKALPLKAQEKLATTMASATFSAETLLAAVESGVASPRVLQRVGVNNRLKSSKPVNWEARVARLTKSLAPANEQLEKLVEQRRKAYDPAKAKSTEGAAIYSKNCAICHRIGSEGALIGPQLDGIGQRGLERLCEDILDPNRNVDRAFRTTLLTLKDGETASGLFRREEGELMILADAAGKENSVPKSSIAERHESETSLMPENFGDLLSPEDFNSLLAFLLSKTAQKQ